MRGCSVQLASCQSREFFVPVADPRSKESEKARIAVDSRHERIKHVGLDALTLCTVAFEPEAASVDSTGAGHRFLQCTVVPAQPLLWMPCTSLTHGALVLFDGETCVDAVSSRRFSRVLTKSATQVDHPHLARERLIGASRLCAGHILRFVDGGDSTIPL